MLLSIIIPVYNVEKYIQKCLDSIVELPIPEDEYEIIVVNDGTQDNSMAIVNSFQKTRKNLHVITQTNKGLSAARNAGLKYATGEWVYFLDSDDYIDARSFKDLFMSSSKNPKVDVIIGNFWYVKDSTICKSRFMINTSHDIYLSGSDFFKKYYITVNTMVWRSIYRRKFLLDHNLYFIEGVYHEDVSWTPQCIASAKMVYYSPIPFYYYIIREGSIIQSARSQKKMNDLILVDKDLLTNSLKFDKEVQKIISFYVLKSLLALNGRYRIFRNQELFNEIKSILLIPAAHSIRYKIVYFLFKTFPWLTNRYLIIRFDTIKRVKSF